MAIRTAALLRAPTGENPTQLYYAYVKERHHSVIEQIDCGQRGLAIVELGRSHLTVVSHEGLLVNAANALYRTNIERILRTTIARTFTLKLPVGFFVHLRFL